MERHPPPRALPDFAIVGAPKCGTTSLHTALAQHPQLCMSSIKEPAYFATDMPGIRYITDEKSYRRLFPGPLEGKLCGESSVILRSKVAIPAMFHANPRIKVIGFVRNPLDLVQSLHNENIRTLREDVLDLEEAWHLQAARARGERIPRLCPDPWMLQYRYLGSLGEQVEAMFRIIPESQRMVLLFDDLKADPQESMRRILRFLGVDDRVLLELPHENTFSLPRTWIMARLFQFLVANPSVNRVKVHVKPFLNAHGMNQIKWLFNLNLRQAAKAPLRPEFRAELVEAFRADVDVLGQLLGRDLSHWQATNVSNSLQRH